MKNVECKRFHELLCRWVWSLLSKHPVESFCRKYYPDSISQFECATEYPSRHNWLRTLSVIQKINVITFFERRLGSSCRAAQRPMWSSAFHSFVSTTWKLKDTGTCRGGSQIRCRWFTIWKTTQSVLVSSSLASLVALPSDFLRVNTFGSSSCPQFAIRSCQGHHTPVMVNYQRQSMGVAAFCSPGSCCALKLQSHFSGNIVVVLFRNSFSRSDHQFKNPIASTLMTEPSSFARCNQVYSWMNCVRVCAFFLLFLVLFPRVIQHLL